jgi:tetratricopeptide (TPR) repeat protein
MQKKIKFNDIAQSTDLVQQGGYYFKRHATNDILQRKTLKNALLLPQNRIIQKPLVKWTSELRSRIQHICSRSSYLTSVKEIAAIFHEAVTLFMYLNQFKYAREICYSQIHMFINWSNRVGEHQLLKHVFQPWIHLIHIDRMEGNYNDAFNKLNVLSKNNKSHILLNENKLWIKLLLHIFHQHDEVHDSLIKQSLFARIQLYFDTSNYAGLIRYIDTQQDEAKDSNKIMMLEAKAIALANTGRLEDSLRLLAHAQSHTESIANYIFSLRECEIRMSLTGRQHFSTELRSLSNALLPFLHTEKNKADHVLIGLYVADVMAATGMQEDAVKLIYFCLEASHQMNDELLKTECLMKLYQLIVDPEGKKIIENLLIEHYYHTQYTVARRKMRDCFHDLKYVENKYHHDDITPLFEDLLIFSSAIK